jgi:hypothetical protein
MYRSPINAITNPNPLCSHTHKRENISQINVEICAFTAEKQVFHSTHFAFEGGSVKSEVPTVLRYCCYLEYDACSLSL